MSTSIVVPFKLVVDDFAYSERLEDAIAQAPLAQDNETDLLGQNTVLPPPRPHTADPIAGLTQELSDFAFGHQQMVVWRVYADNPLCNDCHAKGGIMANAPVPVKAEWEALWTWHHEQQFLAANKEDYAGAEGHKRRAAEIRSYIHGDLPEPRQSAPTSPQEPPANPPVSPPTVSGSMSGVANQVPPIPVRTIGG